MSGVTTLALISAALLISEVLVFNASELSASVNYEEQVTTTATTISNQQISTANSPLPEPSFPHFLMNVPVFVNL
jgi:hypothetical protein